MNIWIINHYAGSVEYGMEFRHYYFAKELIGMGHNITIIAGSYSHLRKYNPDVRETYKEEIHEGIKYIWVPTCYYTGNGIDRVKSMIEFYFRAKNAAKSIRKPDVILSSSPHPMACLAGIKIARKHNVKNISEVRDLWPEAFVYYKGLSQKSVVVKLMEYLEHKIYKKSDALIFTKPGDIDYLREKRWLKSTKGDVDDRKCYYVNNGVDLAAYHKQIIEYEYPQLPERTDEFIITYVGTIREVNNIDMLLDAAKILKDKKITFRIFGDGEQLERLKTRQKEEAINNVHFFGRVEKQFIPNILSKSTINILNYSPTLYNWTRGNSSNKLFEYMACGKPIISTVKMGYSPIEQYQCGVEIENCTGVKLASAIEKLSDLSLMELSGMGENARNAVNAFDYPILTRKLEKILFDTMRGVEK